ncbi:helicase/relaxase domain-containing protein, partial [Pseudomonas aeruginosa]
GELVVQADRASVAQALGGDPARAMAAPKHALQRKLVDGLRYLLKEELKLNQPQASDGWLTENALWLVSKTVSDKLRAHLLSQGIDGIPSSNTAVFNVLQDHGIIQAGPDDKAIWKATVTSDTGWSHSFTFLKLSPALIWEPAERPAPFAGTVIEDMADASTAEEGTSQAPTSVNAAPSASPETAAATPVSTATPAPNPAPAQGDALEDLLSLIGDPTSPVPVDVDVPASLPDTAPPENTAPPPAPTTLPADEAPSPRTTPSGQHFMAWLKQGISSRKLIINDARALVHTVDNTVYLVTPGVFQRYAQEHLQVAALAKQEKVQEWQWVQKRFEKLQLHRKQNSGLNIWTCEVTGPRKSRRLHGYLLEDPLHIFDAVPPNNPYLSLK